MCNIVHILPLGTAQVCYFLVLQTGGSNANQTSLTGFVGAQ